MAHTVGLGLGSNVGDRLANIRKARELLRRLSPDGVVYYQAPLYQSEPVDCAPDSPDFYNTIIEIDFVGDPYQLLRSTQGIEYHLGRETVREPNAPRVIDIDILYFDQLVLTGDILTIPHPQIAHRRFVLQPLSDIRPHFILPGDVVTVEEHLRRLDTGEPDLSLV
ncbi:MAG: 2-amino-4-hydroxy-6-hydroxymethyldihydropteridine diphosphokinase, partial [Verrucomicrobia bacterium]|nr:2-amino-4-hydroxy-6-hydroxymethyldihydropteridine diphosphokinase [Verrucomicrobiota bacterium]